MSEVETIIYKDPVRDRLRMWGNIGIIGGILSSLIGAGLTIGLLPLASNDPYAFLLIVLLTIPLILAGGILAFVGRTPFRHDRYRLRKWYKARIGDLVGNDKT